MSTPPDKNYRELHTGETINGELISPPASFYPWSDTLKASNVSLANVIDCTIAGGMEDAMDINRVSTFIKLQNCKLQSGGLYCMTIKGGSYEIELTDVVILLHGSEVDIDLGNFTEANQDKTTRITLRNVTSTDGKPVIVRVINADRPTVIGGNVKVIVPWWAYWPFWNIYSFLRLHNIVK